MLAKLNIIFIFLISCKTDFSQHRPSISDPNSLLMHFVCNLIKPKCYKYFNTYATRRLTYAHFWLTQASTRYYITIIHAKVHVYLASKYKYTNLSTVRSQRTYTIAHSRLCYIYLKLRYGNFNLLFPIIILSLPHILIT